MAAETANYVERTIEVAGVRVRILQAGAGFPLVVLHHEIGNPGWLAFYSRLARSFEVHVVELPGFRDDARPQWARNARDLAAIAGLTLDRLDLHSIVAVGLGFGGWLVSELATMGQSRYESIVLVAPMGMLPREGEIFDQFMVGHEEYVERGFKDRHNFERLFGDPVPDERLVLWDYARETTMLVAWKPYMYNRALAPLLKSMRVPTLVVWGDDDRIVPQVCGEQYVAALPDSRMETVKDAGHWVEMEQPDRLAALIEDFAGSGDDGHQ